jgi:hypothetical protein
VEGPVGVFVGDPTDVLMSALGSEAQTAAAFVGDTLESTLRNHPDNDSATVSTNNRGLLLDSTELERQAEAVATHAAEVSRADR